MKRFNSLDPISGGKIVDYEIEKDVFDESLTDRSHFVPMAEAVKRLAKATVLGSDIIKTIYDFPDGKDNGMSIPLSRKKGVDIAELSADIRSRSSDIASALSDDVRKATEKKAFNDYLGKVKKDVPPAAPPSSAPEGK